MTVWLAVGVLGFVGGMLWLRAVERSRRSSLAAPLGRTLPATTTPRPEAPEPDALTG